MTQKIESGSGQNSKLRWFVLAMISIVMGTNYYVYDAMSSIKSVMQAELGFSNADYGLIVAFYSFPNTFLLMAIFGGIILDKWGIRKTGFLFVTLCVLGALITAFGASEYFNDSNPLYALFGSFLKGYSPELKMMVLGRLLFGLGAETSIVVVNKVLVRWFKGKELAFAFAINVAIARIGTGAALIFSPILVSSSMGWTTSLWLAAVLMGVGLLAFFIYTVTDNKNTHSTVELSSEDDFRIADIWKIFANKSFIYICSLCVIFYSAVFPFLAFTPDLLHNKFGLSLELSGTMTSIIIFGTVLFTPIFGYLVDKKGKRATLMILGSGMLVLVHLVLSLTNFTPYVAMFLLGIAFSLVPAAMWPSVALVVDEKRLGTAYGIMGSIQNLGLFAFPILAGIILDKTNPTVTQELVSAGKATWDYTYTVLMFAGLGLLGFLFAYLLKREDKGINSHGLENPSV